MCGIIGFTGNLNAKDVLLEGLKALEYRGYDSAGIALQLRETAKTKEQQTGKPTALQRGTGSEAEEKAEADAAEAGKTTHAGPGLFLCKKAGQVARLEQELADETPDSGCGIGHTRWATHGGVTDTNAHPHTTGLVTLIHNGIIENYQELAQAEGISDALISETDSEVACRILDRYYRESRDPKKAVWKTVARIKGTYSFCVMFADRPGLIYCIRSVSPLVASHTKEGSFVASDITALIRYSKDYFVVPEHTLAILSADSISMEEENGHAVEPQWMHVDWDVTAAQKNGFPHFMLKEIYEQPEALRRTIRPRLHDGMPSFAQDQIPDSCFEKIDRICIVACGTASYAGMVGKRIMESILRIPVSVDIASEFRYEDPLVDEKTLCIVISQSGETIDTLKGMQKAKDLGAATLAIVNIKGSTIAREADYVLYTHAGPEIAVASTKAYIVQLAALYLLACRMAFARGKMEEAEAKQFTADLLRAIPSVDAVLETREQIRAAAHRLKDAGNAFYIGRGLDYAFSMEGALKLKEISYIHAEAYAAGELKHGTIALIENGTPVVAIATQQLIYEKTLSNVKEVKARGAFVILITKSGTQVPDGICDIHLQIPQIADHFTVFPVAVVLQLLAYETAAAKGYDMDKPRNLAKSVTVE